MRRLLVTVGGLLAVSSLSSCAPAYYDPYPRHVYVAPGYYGYGYGYYPRRDYGYSYGYGDRGREHERHEHEEHEHHRF